MHEVVDHPPLLADEHQRQVGVVGAEPFDRVEHDGLVLPWLERAHDQHEALRGPPTSGTGRGADDAG